MNLIKKVFSGFISLTTILWSVGFGTFALPSMASAAVLNAGDLVKASGPAVYFYANDQKRYVFPNEKTYFSWFNDFSAVKTITDSELAAIIIGGNVTIRPGTKLVKITTDPKVYAVTRCGTLHWIESEAVANALYGGAWASRVVDVPDGFFVNYSVGSSIPTAVHPDGSLITYASNPGVRYVVWGGMKRMFANDAAWAANGYNLLNVITTTIAYPDGAAVTGRESNLADVVCAGTPVSGGLTVSLASDTPAGATIPRNSSSVQMAKYNLVAGASDVMVSGLKLTRVGVGATSDFANVYLYDGAGNRLTTGRTLNSVTNEIEYSSLNITVPAGGMYSVVVVADFNVAAGSTGGQHSFQLTSAGSVVISGSATIGGSFPVRGNVFTIGTSAAGRLDVQKGTQPTNPNIGAIDAEISNFKLVANTNDIEVRRLTLYQAGSITNTDLTAMNLYQGTTIVATAAAVNGNYIVLNFNPAYVLSQGTTKTFSLHARIAGRAGRTIKTYVEYTTDVYAVDKVYNAGAAVCIASTATGGCTATGQGSFDGTGTNFIEVTTQGGQLTVTFNGPPQQNIAKGSQDVPLFKFSLASPDNTLEIRNINFRLIGQTVDGLASKVRGQSGTDYFRDLKVKNLDTGATIAGPISLPTSAVTCPNSSSNCGLLTIANSFNINMGQILNLAITADIANSADTGDDFLTGGTSTYKVTFGDSTATAGAQIFGSTDVRVVQTGEFLATSKIVPNTAIVGNAQTVKQAALTVALAANPSSQTVVKKQTNIDSVGFVLNAGAQSNILITAMTLTGSASTTGSGSAFNAANLKDVVTSCALFDGATQVGLAISPDTTAGTMAITNMNLMITAGASKTLVVKCTADSVIAQAIADKYAIGILATTDITAQDADGNTISGSAISLSTGVTGNAGTVAASQSVVITVRNTGLLTIATDTLRSSTILVAGTDVWQNFAQFRAQSQFEAIAIQRLLVTSTGESAQYSQVAVASVNGDGLVKGQDTLPAGLSKFKDIDLTANNITVPKDGSVTFQLWGKLAATVASSTNAATAGISRSGALVALGIGNGITTGEYDTNYISQYNVKAVGSASGDRVYATSTNGTTGTSGNSFVVRKTKPTVTQRSLSTTKITSGADLELYKFNVSADSAGSISLKKFVLTFSKSTSSGSSLAPQNFRLRRGNTELSTNDFQIIDQNSDDLEGAAWPMTSSTGYVIVTFTNEEVISGSGSDYTLHATMGGTSVVGDSITVAMTRQTDVTNPGKTGYLTAFGVSSSTLNGILIPGPNLDLGAAPGGAISAGTFLWSDQSDNHNVNIGTSGGSRDWTDDVYVEDLTRSQALSN